MELLYIQFMRHCMGQGFGWGLDKGLIAEIGSRWQLGFSIDNLKPAIAEWNTESQTSEQLSTTSKLGLVTN